MEELLLKQLRVRLREHSNCTREELAVHPRKLEELREDFPHSIRFVEQGEKGCLCFDYALGIHAGIAVFAYHMIGVDPKERDRFVTNFVKDFVLPSLNPVGQEEAHDGDIMIYFEGDKPTHAGILKGGRVISKWGQCPVYDHEASEVPSTYGNQRKTYTKPDGHAMTMKFIEYTRAYSGYKVFESTFEQKIRDYTASRSRHFPSR